MSNETNEPKALNPEVAVEAKKEAPKVEEAKPTPKVENRSVAELADEKHNLLKEVMTKKGVIAEVKQENAELKAQLDNLRKQDLEAQGKWEQLYKSESERAEKLEVGILEREKKMEDIYKVNAVSEHLRFKNSDYKAFIKRDAIELDENKRPTEDSLLAEVDRIRQIHPELLDNRPKGQIPNMGGQKLPEKPLNEMSKSEMVDMIMKGTFNK